MSDDEAPSKKSGYRLEYASSARAKCKGESAVSNEGAVGYNAHTRDFSCLFFTLRS